MCVYLFFVCLAALLLAFLLTLVLEPISRILGKKPLWFEILICLSLPFVSGVLFGACGTGGPGPDVGAGIRIAAGFIVGFVVGVSLLLGRWFPRAVVVTLTVVASVAWFLGGMETVWACEIVWHKMSGEFFFPRIHEQLFTPAHQIISSLTFAVVSLGADVAVWRFRDRAKRQFSEGGVHNR